MLSANISLANKTILVSGAAGFIGAALVQQLLRSIEPICIVGIDNLNDYYDPGIKQYRLRQISQCAASKPGSQWHFFQESISEAHALQQIFKRFKPSLVFNLAAQAGVRHSIKHPEAYIDSNIVGFFNVLEACRYNAVEHLLYASSSSVYGCNTKLPYATEDPVDHPVSLYAATKKSNELMAHAYAKLYAIPCTGLRFFTVYGPGGRPDMAYYSFTDKLLKGECISIFNYGNCQRDFTYIDDIVESLCRIAACAPKKSLGPDALPQAPYRLYNIGNNSPVMLLEFIKTLHEELIQASLLPPGHKLQDQQILLPMQPGDVPVTYADTQPLERDFGFKPSTTLKTGLHKFVQWYKEYYKL
ncbi:MAG: NAD-dependent epimerase/dehydratase family protein [Lentisphaeria bacterium]|nr:NAD-dependent epimerase/dehydratase family protein [Lentisphaeria bacterium]